MSKNDKSKWGRVASSLSLAVLGVVMAGAVAVWMGLGLRTYFGAYGERSAGKEDASSGGSEGSSRVQVLEKPLGTGARVGGVGMVLEERGMAAGSSGVERHPPDSLKRWLRMWQDEQLRGNGTTRQQVEELGNLFKTESVSGVHMGQILQLIWRMDGDWVAEPLLGMVGTRLARELEEADAVRRRSDVDGRMKVEAEEAGLALAAAAWSTHELLWRVKYHELNLRLTAALKPWLAYGSGPSQLAGYRYAEMLYLCSRIDEAKVALRRLVEERGVATEPSWGINRALDWEMGVMLLSEGNASGAIPYLEAATGLPGHIPESKAAWPLLIQAVAQAGEMSKADELFKKWEREARPTEDELEQLRVALRAGATR